jgi:hypothetical protein
MKTFNAIQMVVLLALAPTLLTLVHTAGFVGAGAVFWTGLVGSVGLFIWTTFLVRAGMESE